MRIYRFEDHEGIGPYVSEAAYRAKNAWGAVNDYSRCPGPRDDFNVDSLTELYPRVGLESPGSFGRNKHFLFGFHKKELTKKWFIKRIRKAMYAHGTRLYAYDVPDNFVIPAKKQCVFNAIHAKKIGEVRLKEDKDIFVNLFKELEIYYDPFPSICKNFNSNIYFG